MIGSFFGGQTWLPFGPYVALHHGHTVVPMLISLSVALRVQSGYDTQTRSLACSDPIEVSAEILSCTPRLRR